MVRIRSEKNWNQSDLARAADMQRQHIYRLKHGKINPSAYFLKQISEAKEIPFTQILDL